MKKLKEVWDNVSKEIDSLGRSSDSIEDFRSLKGQYLDDKFGAGIHVRNYSSRTKADYYNSLVVFDDKGNYHDFGYSGKYRCDDYNFPNFSFHDKDKEIDKILDVRMGVDKILTVTYLLASKEQEQRTVEWSYK